MSQAGISGSAWRARSGTVSDINAAATIYTTAFIDEPLLDFVYPNRKSNMQTFHTWIRRRFHSRYWTPGYSLTVVDGDDGCPVGFSWWHQPTESLSLYERFLCPNAWIGYAVRTISSLRDYFFPLPNYDAEQAAVFKRVMDEVEAEFMNTPRRRRAWYLSILAVDSTLQSKGVGTLLLKHGLQRVDQAGVSSWLISVEGMDTYYGKHGFVEVARANVGELKEWKGGAIMLRE